MSRHVVTDFVNYNDSRLLKEYFDSNQHLCGDIREEHKHRNIHFKVIEDISFLWAKITIRNR